MSVVPVTRALISVYDKEGLVPFAQRLQAAGVHLISSGGTAKALEEAGVAVTTVEEVTGAPEMFGGRVKTLHPMIHGGILARLDVDSDVADLEANAIEPFQLVVVNLYPFRETVASGASIDEVIEKIDIGGPALVRAAAKNHRHVGIVSSPEQYEEVAQAVESGGLGDDLRKRLAADAFFRTAAYDAAIVGWIGEDLVIPLRLVSQLRYGENPHQEAALYVEEGARPWWRDAVQHQGKEMSFNNYADAEAAWRLANAEPGMVVIVKHTNPCGAARGDSVADTFEQAWACDPMSAFGGVIAVNGVVEEKTARSISEKFVEVLICAGVTDEALTVLGQKSAVRVLAAGPPGHGDPDMSRLEEGFLVQDRDEKDNDAWEVVSERSPTEEERLDLAFAWTVAMHTKSNAIVIVKDQAAIGVGAGDQSRVGAAERAVVKAGDRARGGAAASDAFFPFRDGLDALAGAGVTAVIEPGGSRNDQEVIDAANEHGIALVFASNRHFRH
ncbi:MAG TPA: bifunctional phosphoribosylaminoimidazolecarboxamide formyltransferase/IMP cyclohydrolase [Acidimicrobiia bacterium]|nr:bifunctional phosphoribosylaminoimidazolecarboxamide formyltransferase/IMP cyclohydrolase [Acidimicrobiia bacterium]